MEKYLRETYFFDYQNELIQELIKALKTDKLSEVEKAKACYLRIRDGWRYNPYELFFSKEKWKASWIAGKSEAHCIDKSTLLVACLRGLGIPTRIQFAKVKNHIAVEKLIERFGTNELSPHGMINVFLNGKWLKASPAFNAELCKKCNVGVLDFDGINDSVFQEYNKEGHEFMEYLEDYGHFDDLPFDFIIENMKSHYPRFEEYMKRGDKLVL